MSCAAETIRAAAVALGLSAFFGLILVILAHRTPVSDEERDE